MDLFVRAVTEETALYKKALNKFVTVNCDGTILYWYTNGNIEYLSNWYNGKNYDGPCNDDKVLYLEVEEGHVLFNYMEQFEKEHYDCIPCFEILPEIWKISAIMQVVGYNQCVNEQEQAEYEHERNTRFDIIDDDELHWELMFTDENGQERKYYDFNNFLWEFADGNYYTADKISDVILNGFDQDYRMNITSMFELACLLDATDKYKFRGNADSYSCKVPEQVEESIFASVSDYLFREGDKVRIEGDVELDDYNVRVSTMATVLDNQQDKFAQVYCCLDEIDGDHHANVFVNADIIKLEETTFVKDDSDSAKSNLLHEGTMAVLVSCMPKDFSGFNSQTGYGEPQHWMDLPNGRTLEIVYEETGDDNRYYSWRIHCSNEEFDTGLVDNQGGIIAGETSDNFEYDMVYTHIEWAIKQATTIPIFKKPEYSFSMGEEICIKGREGETWNGYVIDYIPETFLTVVFPDRRNIIKYLPDSFERLFKSKTGGENDLVNALF